jgi:hypothetical protein
MVSPGAADRGQRGQAHVVDADGLGAGRPQAVDQVLQVAVLHPAVERRATPQALVLLALPVGRVRQPHGHPRALDGEGAAGQPRASSRRAALRPAVSAPSAAACRGGHVRPQRSRPARPAARSRRSARAPRRRARRAARAGLLARAHLRHGGAGDQPERDAPPGGCPAPDDRGVLRPPGAAGLAGGPLGIALVERVAIMSTSSDIDPSTRRAVGRPGASVVTLPSCPRTLRAGRARRQASGVVPSTTSAQRVTSSVASAG